MFSEMPTIDDEERGRRLEIMDDGKKLRRYTRERYEVIMPLGERIYRLFI